MFSGNLSLSTYFDVFDGSVWNSQPEGSSFSTGLFMYYATDFAESFMGTKDRYVVTSARMYCQGFEYGSPFFAVSKTSPSTVVWSDLNSPPDDTVVFYFRTPYKHIRTMSENARLLCEGWEGSPPVGTDVDVLYYEPSDSWAFVDGACGTLTLDAGIDNQDLYIYIGSGFTFGQTSGAIEIYNLNVYVSSTETVGVCDK